MNFIRMGSLLLLAWPVVSFSETPQKSTTLENYSVEKGFARSLPLTDAAHKTTITKPKQTTQKSTAQMPNLATKKSDDKTATKKAPKKFSLFTKRQVNKNTVSVKTKPAQPAKQLLTQKKKAAQNDKTIQAAKKQPKTTTLATKIPAPIIDPNVIIKQCDAQYKAGDYTKALLACKKAAEQNDSQAQFTLARIYSIGVAGKSPDYKNALEYLNLAAKQNHPQAQFMLALCYQNGIGVSRDNMAALNWYQKAVKNGLPNAALIDTTDVVKNDTVAHTSWPGSEEFKIATIELKDPENRDEGIKTLAAAADKGHPIAQYQLAMQHLRGENIAQDDAKAVEWLGKAAQMNYQPAQSYLAWMTMLGLGTKQNNQAAINLFLEAKQLNVNNDYDPSLQEKLSQLTSPPVPVRKQPTNAKQRRAAFKRGVELIETSAQFNPEGFAIVTDAAEHNLPDAQLYLANLYEQGDKIPQDIEKSTSWYQRAASAGNIEAQYALGWHYYHGQGLPKNSDLALNWFHQASLAGHERAQHAESFLALQQMEKTPAIPETPTLGNRIVQKVNDNVKGIMNAVGLDRFSGYYRKS